jgi:hypothetical protein
MEECFDDGDESPVSTATENSLQAKYRLLEKYFALAAIINRKTNELNILVYVSNNETALQLPPPHSTQNSE